MGAGEFLLIFITIILAFIFGIAFIGMKYDTEQLEKENKKLKEDLHKARSRKMKKESK